MNSSISQVDPATKHLYSMLLDKLARVKDYINDHDVQEIMINGQDNVWVEKAGVTFKSDVVISNLDIKAAIEILGKLNNKDVKANSKDAIVDSRIDGLRIAAALSPIASEGHSICIRRHSTNVFSLEDLVSKGTLSAAQSEVLKDAVISKKNILISGGTSSGKTTLLNALSGAIPESERILIIEDTREIRVKSPNRVFLEANSQVGISIRDLVRLSLRYAPDRILVGEIRGGEAFDLMRAMNSGHEGGMTTIHANNASLALSALETLILTAGESWPYEAIQNQIGLTFDYVIQVGIDADHKRRVLEILRVKKFNHHTKEYEIDNINPDATPETTLPAEAS